MSFLLHFVVLKFPPSFNVWLHFLVFHSFEECSPLFQSICIVASLKSLNNSNICGTSLLASVECLFSGELRFSHFLDAEYLEVQAEEFWICMLSNSVLHSGYFGCLNTSDSGSCLN